ncbi:uncharacterized protein MELLADRAFT_112798 [Melampsora larici-populina 98AG31]|uniref:CxC1-like cysteine cluster associated with KDZ transposases domain-containing protein n=1 Tax=Melampsora larici-populina (strain 98AG31 / pathotype 3-4-7) TaxID=747676 RepID=F4S7M9_MELLP|nr:uncharacterized protein MELLADRAFT_112798 [Melampsora larici-populina 98AG31]EGF99350.1 hypothetical protein MELLADRAFT_112798 [Melampsora larici-populina 98AG31]
MPSQRRIFGLNHRPKQPKPSTPRQHQLVRSRQRDLAHAEASNAAFLQQINVERNLQAGEGPLGDEDGGVAMDFVVENDQHGEEEEEEAVVSEEEIDLNRFMPGPGAPNVNDDADDALLAALRRQAHLEDRLAHEKKWLWQYAIMLPTYLQNRLETKDWGDQEKWNLDLRPACHCTIRTERDIDLVDLLTRRRTKVSFCKNCDLSAPQRLLQMGYMAASPSRPRTAFSLRLLVHHHAQWIRFAVPTEGFCEALDSTLDHSSPVILTSKGRVLQLYFVTVSFMATQTEKYRLELPEADKALENHARANVMHTAEYCQDQWDRQRAQQLKAISVKTKEKRERLGVFQKLIDLNAMKVPVRTAEQREDLLNLPRSLVALESKIQELADELGNAELLNNRQGSTVRVKAILSIQVALGFLYEAAVDLMQENAHAATRTGATQQPQNEKLRQKKRAQLKKKLATYIRHASKYNRRFRPHHRLLEPTLDEVMAMDLLDPFWDEVALNHPDEPWATCESTKNGIIALRSRFASEEELRRLGREVRQLMGWAVDYQARIDQAKPNEGLMPLKTHEFHVIQSTCEFVEGSADGDPILIHAWQDIMAHTSGTWAEILGEPILWADGDYDEEAGFFTDHEIKAHIWKSNAMSDRQKRNRKVVNSEGIRCLLAQFNGRT